MTRKRGEQGAAKCIVCQQVGEGSLCRACSRSYDRMAAKEGDLWDTIVWAAKRARAAERARHLRGTSRWRADGGIFSRPARGR